MKKSLAVVLFSVSLPGLADAQAKPPASTTAPATAAVKYGANAAAGRIFTHDGVKLSIKVTGMMLVEPHIDVKALETITAPTLVLAADHDVIRDEHTIDIFHHLPNSQLAIFPNATHMIPYDDPATFNATVERFLRTPFVKRERIKDTMTSLEKMKAS